MSLDEIVLQCFIQPDLSRLYIPISPMMGEIGRGDTRAVFVGGEGGELPRPWFTSSPPVV